MKQSALPRDEEQCYERLTGLYGAFLEGSGWLREKYRRNHELYLEQVLGRDQGQGLRTGTPVLYATYRTELSDAMEAIPEALFLARRKGDEEKARRITSLHRAVLERLGFAEEYQRICEYRLRYGVGYSESGVADGEPTVRAFDPRAVLTDPLCEDLQEGRAVFKISCHSPEYYAAKYPKAFEELEWSKRALPGWSGSKDVIPMLSCYIKERTEGGTAVHLIKLAAGQVLYDSRNTHAQGLYRHGEYPFVAWIYDRIPGTPWGFGCFDYLAPVQEYIDKVDTLVLRSLQRTARPRLIVNRAAGIDPDLLRDEREEIIEADRVDESAMRWQPAAPLAPYAIEMLNLKTEMLKRESGQNAASRGSCPPTLAPARPFPCCRPRAASGQTCRSSPSTTPLPAWCARWCPTSTSMEGPAKPIGTEKATSPWTRRTRTAVGSWIWRFACSRCPNTRASTRTSCCCSWCRCRPCRRARR